MHLTSRPRSPCGRSRCDVISSVKEGIGAGDGIRTRDIQLGRPIRLSAVAPCSDTRAFRVQLWCLAPPSSPGLTSALAGLSFPWSPAFPRPRTSTGRSTRVNSRTFHRPHANNRIRRHRLRSGRKHRSRGFGCPTTPHRILPTSSCGRLASACTVCGVAAGLQPPPWQREVHRCAESPTMRLP